MVFLALMGLKADLLFITVSGFMMFVFASAIQIGAEVLILVKIWKTKYRAEPLV